MFDNEDYLKTLMDILDITLNLPAFRNTAAQNKAAATENNKTPLFMEAESKVLVDATMPI